MSRFRRPKPSNRGRCKRRRYPLPKASRSRVLSRMSRMKLAIKAVIRKRSSSTKVTAGRTRKRLCNGPPGSMPEFSPMKWRVSLSAAAEPGSIRPSCRSPDLPTSSNPSPSHNTCRAPLPRRQFSVPSTGQTTRKCEKYLINSELVFSKAQ